MVEISGSSRQLGSIVRNNEEQSTKPLVNRAFSLFKNYAVSIISSEEFKTAFFAFSLGFAIGKTGIFPNASLYERSVSSVPPHDLLNGTCVLK